MSNDLDKQLSVYDEVFRLHDENKRLSALPKKWLATAQKAAKIALPEKAEFWEGYVAALGDLASASHSPIVHWVTFGKTESGDDLAPIVWDHKPDEDEVDAMYRAKMPLEYEQCGGVEHRTVEALVENKSGADLSTNGV